MKFKDDTEYQNIKFLWRVFAQLNFLVDHHKRLIFNNGTLKGQKNIYSYYLQHNYIVFTDEFEFLWSLEVINPLETLMHLYTLRWKPPLETVVNI